MHLLAYGIDYGIKKKEGKLRSSKVKIKPTRRTEVHGPGHEGAKRENQGSQVISSYV